MILSNFLTKHKKAILNASRIVLFVGLLTLGFLFYRDNFLRAPVRSASWYDGSFGYRQSVLISNDQGSELTNEHVLVELDTAALISNGKMQSDCDDIRFIDSDDLTNLDYWIEGNCNASNTQIWVEVPSLPSQGKTISLYYGNVGATGGGLGWAGNVYIYSDQACPSGWTRVSAADDRFLYGSSTAGQTGGSATHTHDDVTCTSDTISTTNVGGVDATGNNGTTANHTHGNLKANFENESSLPPYSSRILCSKPSFTLPAGAISIFKALPASNWTRQSSLDDIFPMTDDTVGQTGGSATHLHTLTTGIVTGLASATQTTGPVSATGGTVTQIVEDGITYNVHTFTSSGTLNVTASGSVEVLVVAGGGGGGWNAGGGGGAGGVIENSSYSVSSGQNITVTVGNGGTPGAGWPNWPLSTNGQNSVFGSLTAIGGGAGGNANFQTGGLNGGSGGGCAAFDALGGNGTIGQGFGGGDGVYRTGSFRAGSGGGGASEVGEVSPSGEYGGNGGDGIQSSITGTATWYGGGGGGGTPAAHFGSVGIGGLGGGANGAGGTDSPAPSGTPNTGGGGGGGGGYQEGGPGGHGGSGIVIVRYAVSSAGGNVASSTHTHTSTSGNTTSESNLPPYMEVIFGKSSSEAYVPDNVVLPMDQIPPLGWSRVTELDSRFTRGNLSYGTTGGSSTHTHDVSISTGVPSATTSAFGTGLNFADSTHTHSCSGQTSSEGSNIPPYYSVIYAERMISQNAVLGSEERPIPNAPTIGTGEALSTTSIRWKFTDNADDELGFKVYDMSGNLKATCVGENLSYCDETGLSENTAYTRVVVAYNAYGNSDDSDFELRLTLVSPPTLEQPSSKTTSSITLVGSGRVNNSLLYFDCTSGSCNTGLNHWVAGDSDTVTDLSPNTGYTFRVKGKNGNDIETAYSSTSEIYTLAETPTLGITQSGISTLELTVGNTTNLAAGSSGVIFECTGTSCDSGINEWVTTKTDVVTGLSPNTEYAFKAKARNYDGTETTYSSDISGYTLAATPTISASNITTSSIDLNIDNSVNMGVGDTAIFFECTGDSCNTGINTWNSTNIDTVTGLQPNTEYTFRAKTRNVDGIETTYSEDLVVRTLSEVPTISTGSITANSVTLTGGNVTNLTSGSSGILFECTGDSCNAGINEWINTTTDIVTDLIANTVYNFRVKGRNQAGVETAFSTQNTILTLAKTPSISASDITTNSLNLNASEVNNLEVGSSGIIFECVDENCNTGINEWIQNSSDSVSDLLPNTEYSFKAKSKNQLETETSYSEILTVSTLADVPTLTVSNITTDSVQLSAGNINNISEGDSGLMFSCDSNNCEEGIGDWITIEQDSVTNLSPDTTYVFKVKAKNQAGIETKYSDTVQIRTEALPVEEEPEEETPEVDSTPTDEEDTAEDEGSIINASKEIKIVLVEDEETILTEEEKEIEGEQKVRVVSTVTEEGEYLIADLPILFTEEKLDWKEAILETKPKENKTVVKLQEEHGIKGAFTMYIVKGDTNALRICPEAQSLIEVSPTCPQVIELTGVFPQETKVEDANVTVSHAVIGGTEYWIADGLTGTGAEGFYDGKDIEDEDIIDSNDIVEKDSALSIWLLIILNILLVGGLVIILVIRRRRK